LLDLGINLCPVLEELLCLGRKKKDNENVDFLRFSARLNTELLRKNNLPSRIAPKKSKETKNNNEF